MKAVQRKVQATAERAWWNGVHINDKAGIDLGLDIVGHPATIDDELVYHLVFPRES